MTWVKIDDLFPEHPKVQALGDNSEAIWLFIAGVCKARNLQSDGHLSMRLVRSLTNGPDATEAAEALVAVGLWEHHPEDGYLIHDYQHWQQPRDVILRQQALSRTRSARYRQRHTPAMPEPPNGDGPHLPVPAPRVHSAAAAVQRIGDRLGAARERGVNAWNLSTLVQDEWDTLHDANDIGGCIALTVWYATELLTRKPSSSEIARIGQMTKRFGRISLLAIDEALIKDPTDLVSYAFRVAQGMYDEQRSER